MFSGSHTPELYIPSEDELKLIQEFIASVETNTINSGKATTSKTKYLYNHLKKFNPNKVLVSEMEKMGFPDRVISNIIKYRNSGGHFNFPEDLRKIYGLTDSAFILLRPYILLEKNILKERMIRDTSQKLLLKITLININTADSLQLISLQGIGPELAIRIMKFRKRLGGFVKPEQLLEVYGLSVENYNLFKDRIYVNHDDIRKMDINHVSYAEMIRHPYMNEEIAASIIKFRDFRGRITDIRELYLYNIASKENLEKIESYLLVP